MTLSHKKLIAIILARNGAGRAASSFRSWLNIIIGSRPSIRSLKSFFFSMDKSASAMEAAYEQRAPWPAIDYQKLGEKEAIKNMRALKQKR